MSKKAVIISGGTIDDKFVLQMLNEIQAEYVIGVDRGLQFLYRNRVMPTHIVGDFDSVEAELVEHYEKQTQVPIRKFRPEKDASDTEIALHLAIELGAEKVWILGGTGNRLDHVMANIQILKIAHDQGIKAYLQDTNNRISLAEKEVKLCKEDSSWDYFSVFPFGGVVDDISIEGAKYPLSHCRLCPNSSMCVSNEMQENEVKIAFPTGTIILMETRDS